MLHVERRKEILNKILKEGSVKADALAKHYKVGVPTIRRDLKYLAAEYGIELTYGGAYAKESMAGQTTVEMNIAQKKLQNLEEKRIIAQKAAGLIEDGDTIALNSGSTVELILDYLEDINNLNVITLSLNVAFKASTIKGVNVFMPGGRLRSISGAFHGRSAEEFLRQFNIDKAFMGVLAVSIAKGVTHSSLEEIEINQTLAEISQKCYLMADHTKFDKVSLAKMFDLNIFDAFIVDGQEPEIYREYARNNGIAVI
ncbi:MAG: DeoR/GlpR family DNA-binding transcription regulator [Eubacterium sp.]|nr:DeoR/GlpR family DNA-binding transcription regulator [Eubacterium sp.]